MQHFGEKLNYDLLLQMYPDISEVESQYEPSLVDLNVLPVPQILAEPTIHAAPLPRRTRSKRAPSGLYHLVFGRRTQRSPLPSPQSLDISDQTDSQRLHDLLVKMRLWEAALLIHFRDRFQQTPEALATDPMWAKLIQVSNSIVKATSNLCKVPFLTFVFLTF